MTIDDSAVAVGALVHDLFRDAEGARRCAITAASGRHVGPADVFAIAEDVGLLLAEIDVDAGEAAAATTVPDIQRRAAGIDGLHDDGATHFDDFIRAERRGALGQHEREGERKADTGSFHNEGTFVAAHRAPNQPCALSGNRLKFY